MNLISCGLDCHYQHDGYCNLDNPAAVGSNCTQDCIYYVPKGQFLPQNRIDGLADGTNTDELHTV